jgi:uncharacterized protein involved in exopolysaccharide biosynthesis
MASAVEPRLEARYDDDIDLSLVIMRLWAARRWIIACVIVSTAAFAAYAFLSTRIYSAATVFISASADRSGLGDSLSGLGGLASLAGINLSALGGGAAETQEALAVLKSRQFTEVFIRERDLMPEFFPNAWDETTKSWKPGKLPPTLAKAYKYFNTKVRHIVEDKKTGLIELRINWKDRNEAAAWANELVDRLNQEMRRRAMVSADASVGYLEKELQATDQVATREAINRLIETQVKQRMLANVTQEYAFRVVDKALPADANDPVKPRKLLLLVAGPLVGGVFGVAAVLFLGWIMETMRARRAS